MASDNRLLGEFNLEGIPPAPMGVPQIEVSFNIDANGILQVSAKDKGTGKEQTIKIESSGGLTKEEIDRMQRDAQANAAQDKRRRELAEARNTAEQRVYQLEKLLNESQGRLSEADMAAVRSAIEKVNQVKNGDDPSAIQRAIDDLQRASQAMSQHLHEPSATAGRRSTQNGPSSSSDGRRILARRSSMSNSRRSGKTTSRTTSTEPANGSSTAPDLSQEFKPSRSSQETRCLQDSVSHCKPTS